MSDVNKQDTFVFIDIFYIVVNVTMKPAAGILGAIVHPAQGAWKSAQKQTVARKQEQHQRSTRIEDGKLAVERSTHEERSIILKRFEASKAEAPARKKAWKERAETALKEDAPQSETADSASGPSNPTSDKSSVSATSPRSEVSTTIDTRSNTLPPTPAPPAADDDAAFERDLEMAKQLSLAEQRGYERGMAMRANES